MTAKDTWPVFYSLAPVAFHHWPLSPGTDKVTARPKPKSCKTHSTS